MADHKAAYDEVGSQGISYTAGVPPVAAAMLVATGAWDVRMMKNVEELDPKPFFAVLDQLGLATRVQFNGEDRAWNK